MMAYLVAIGEADGRADRHDQDAGLELDVALLDRVAPTRRRGRGAGHLDRHDRPGQRLSVRTSNIDRNRTRERRIRPEEGKREKGSAHGQRCYTDALTGL
ncbi:hypothetical protein AB5I41_10525 [Sphingomonas sp. MMS24-JH45]